MTITIRQDIQDYDSLSKAAQLVLGFIPGGEHWVKESSDAQAPHYVFSSEGEFLSAVLDGLHNTSLLYLFGAELLTDPENLLLLGDKKLGLIKDYIKEGDDESAIELLKDNGLLSNSILHSSSHSLLLRCGVSTNALFQVMSLNDLLGLNALAESDLLTNFKPKAAVKDAASYALKLAQTPLEFCQLVGFYLTVLNKLGINSESSEIRELQVQTVYRSISWFANEMLICPQISGSTSAEEVNQAISTWIGFGNEFGFSSLPAAIEQISLNINLEDLFESQIGSEVARYQKEIQDFMRGHEVSEPRLSQDGNRLFYRVDSFNPTVQFSLNKQGYLVLDQFVHPLILAN